MAEFWEYWYLVAGFLYVAFAALAVFRLVRSVRRARCGQNPVIRRRVTQEKPND